MKLGWCPATYTVPGGPAQLAQDLATRARVADNVGFNSMWVPDHYFQIPIAGPPEQEMLEGYSVLSFLAAHTSRIRLGTLVTGVHYRHPGLLAKIVTTLDVLSGGRANFGIGAAWNETESRGLGVPFPALSERYQRLEETLQICLRMWSDDEKPWTGMHYQLDRPMNSPQCISRPHPPILIGGSGERKTLRLVAEYADACNLFPGPQIPAKLDVLRAHCETVGRDYDDIEKTTMYGVDLGSRGERCQQVSDALGGRAEQGMQSVIVTVNGGLDELETMGDRVIPAIADL